MSKRRFRLPSPAMVIAMLALTLVLGGTAVAASTSAPLTKSSATKLIKKLAPKLSVKNAAHLGGESPSAYARASPLYFTSPSLQNSWVAAGGFGTPGYAKDQFGVVHLTGAVANSAGSNAVVLTLPAGFRPAAPIDASVAVYGPASGVARIDSNGDIFAIASTKFMDLDGVTFVAGS